MGVALTGFAKRLSVFFKTRCRPTLLVKRWPLVQIQASARNFSLDAGHLPERPSSLRRLAVNCLLADFTNTLVPDPL